MDINFIDSSLTQYLPFLVPVIILQLTLMLTALIHILRHKTYKVGTRAIWIIVVVFINIFGPIAYFVFGRGDEWF